MLATLERPTAQTARARIIRPLDFQLPAALEARVPPEARGLARDDVRLLVSYRDGDRVVHTRFRQIAEFLDPGDLIVVNDSITIPAALSATRANGDELALHLSTRVAPDGVRPDRVGPDMWVVEPRKTAVRVGERLSLPAGGSAEITAPHHGSTRLWRARLDVPLPWLPYLEAHGRPIAYDYVDGEWPLTMYQTVYGANPGSSEMPSAGRPFSSRVMEALRRKGVGISPITLHTGVASLEDHEPPYEEWFSVPAATADAIASTRAVGGRVIAVGTTVVRALETAAEATGAVVPRTGWTDLIVTPEAGVRTVDGMLTGFHEPKASHLAMLEAIAGRDHLTVTYKAALTGGYLWHEFGDLHLIL